MGKKPLSSEEISKPLTTAEEIRKRMSFYVHEVGDGQKTARSLTLEEVEEACRYVFEGKCSEAQIATFLVALRIKGSSDDERFGLLNILRGYNEVPDFEFSDLLDYSGFYDGRDGELHLSPAIALVAASAGGRVILTGGRSKNNNTLHRITLQEVLNESGVRVTNSLHEVGESLRRIRVGFVDTHRVNRALNNPVLDRIREDVGLRTPINTMEVSLNPTNAPYHIRGMFHPGSKEQVARIMARLRIKRGLMVTGIAGSGEIPTYKPAEGYEIIQNKVNSFALDPVGLGFSPGKRAHLISETPKDQAEKLVKILEGTAEGTLRDMTILNAAVILYTSEKVDSIEKGIRLAHKALDSREPLRLLEAWRKA
jgi:anthranilate phosphoribosyltransferase